MSHIYRNGYAKAEAQMFHNTYSGYHFHFCCPITLCKLSMQMLHCEGDVDALYRRTVNAVVASFGSESNSIRIPFPFPPSLPLSLSLLLPLPPAPSRSPVPVPLDLPNPTSLPQRWHHGTTQRALVSLYLSELGLGRG